MSGTDIEPTDELASFLENLYDNGISGGISWSRGRWRARIGKTEDRPKAEATFGSLVEAAEWLRRQAIEVQPISGFATAYRRHPE